MATDRDRPSEGLQHILQLSSLGPSPQGPADNLAQPSVAPKTICTHTELPSCSQPPNENSTVPPVATPQTPQQSTGQRGAKFRSRIPRLRNSLQPNWVSQIRLLIDPRPVEIRKTPCVPNQKVTRGPIQIRTVINQKPVEIKKTPCVPDQKVTRGLIQKRTVIEPKPVEIKKSPCVPNQKVTRGPIQIRTVINQKPVEIKKSPCVPGHKVTRGLTQKITVIEAKPVEIKNTPCLPGHKVTRGLTQKITVIEAKPVEIKKTPNVPDQEVTGLKTEIDSKVDQKVTGLQTEINAKADQGKDKKTSHDNNSSDLRSNPIIQPSVLTAENLPRMQESVPKEQEGQQTSAMKVEIKKTPNVPDQEVTELKTEIDSKVDQKVTGLQTEVDPKADQGNDKKTSHDNNSSDLRSNPIIRPSILTAVNLPRMQESVPKEQEGQQTSAMKDPRDIFGIGVEKSRSRGPFDWYKNKLVKFIPSKPEKMVQVLLSPRPLRESCESVAPACLGEGDGGS